MRCVIYPLHLLYIIVFIIGMTNEIGAICSASVAIPSIYYLKDLCFVLYFIVMLGLKQKNFFIDWQDLVQNQQDQV